MAKQSTTRAGKKSQPSWTTSDLVRVSELYYKQNLTQEEIGKAVGRSRADVNRMLKKAEEEGVVTIVVADPWNHYDLRELEWKLKQKFPCLLEVIVVPGHQSMVAPRHPKGIDPESLRAGVIFAMAQAASQYISRNLNEDDVIAIGQGQVIKMVVNGCRVSRPMPRLRIVPMAGYSFAHYHPQDCGVIAEEFARITSGELWWLPVPFMVPAEQSNNIEKLPVIHKTLQVFDEVTTVLTSLGPITDMKIHALVDAEFLSQQQMSDVLKRFKAEKAKRPAGELCGWLFAADGSPVTHDWLPLCPIGMGTDRIKRIVESNSGKVIVVAGAQQSRVNAIRAALNGSLMNVLVTDSATVQILLREPHHRNG